MSSFQNFMYQKCVRIAVWGVSTGPPDFYKQVVFIAWTQLPVFRMENTNKMHITYM